MIAKQRKVISIQPTLLFITFLCSLFLTSFSFVGAEVDSLKPGKVNQEYMLVQTCDNCTYINVTKIRYPNQSETYPNVRMSQTVNGNYNYSFTPTVIGDYIVTTCGNPDGYYTCDSYDFTISTTGNDFYSMIPLFLLLCGSFILALGLYFREPFLGVPSGIMLTISGVYFIIYGLGVIQNVYTQAIGFTSLLLGLVIAFSAIAEVLGEQGSSEDE